MWTDETFFALPDGKGAYLAFGSPWHGMLQAAENQKGVLRKIFFLEKNPTHYTSVLSGADALKRLLKEAFLPPWDGGLTEALLNNIELLLRTVPAEELHFAKDASVVEFVSEAGAFRESATNL